MALGLRTCTITSEDPSLVPSNQARASVYIIQNNFKNESLKKKNPGAHTHTHTPVTEAESRDKRRGLRQTWASHASQGYTARPGLRRK